MSIESFFVLLFIPFIPPDVIVLTLNWILYKVLYLILSFPFAYISLISPIHHRFLQESRAPKKSRINVEDKDILTLNELLKIINLRGAIVAGGMDGVGWRCSVRVDASKLYET